MSQVGRRFWIGCAVSALAFLLLGIGTAGAKPKPNKHEHALLTFSGTGKGAYSWSVPEDDVGAEPGTCNAASNSYSVDDDYSFKWSEKFSFPEGAGSYVMPADYKVTGTDVTTQAQGTCKNGFGNGVGGDSYSCTTPWGPFEQGTDYPTMSLGGSPSHKVATTRGAVAENGAPTGTNCIGAALGGASEGFELNLKGALKFSAAALERKGSLSKAVSGTKSASCGSTTCEHDGCTDSGSPADVPTTCSTQQSYSGELKIKLLK
jgi:hypothetical protein